MEKLLVSSQSCTHTHRLNKNKFRFKNNNEQSDGSLVESLFEGTMISLTLNKIYDVLEEDDEYYRIVDNTEDDYLYPKTMF